MKWIILIAVATIATGCSFGGHMDWIEDGSKLQSSYQRDRYQDVRTGMDYISSEQKKPEEYVVPVSPRHGWDKSWMK